VPTNKESWGAKFKKYALMAGVNVKSHRCHGTRKASATEAGRQLIGCLVFVARIEFLLASIVVFTLGDGLFQPSINAIIAKAVPAGAQGAAQGANQSQQALARMLGPLLAAVLSPFSAGGPYWTGGLIAIAGVVVLSVSGRSVPSEAG
jgi:MFS family permease